MSYLEDRTKSAVGVDLSPSMLEVARKNKRSAEIIEADLTRSDVLGDRKFNLITAFRFFPNAEAELRSEAMQVLAGDDELGVALAYALVRGEQLPCLLPTLG